MSYRPSAKEVPPTESSVHCFKHCHRKPELHSSSIGGHPLTKSSVHRFTNRHWKNPIAKLFKRSSSHAWQRTLLHIFAWKKQLRALQRELPNATAACTASIIPYRHRKKQLGAVKKDVLTPRQRTLLQGLPLKETAMRSSFLESSLSRKEAHTSLSLAIGRDDCGALYREFFKRAAGVGCFTPCHC